ncbi:MAG: bifunctional 5,10-methylenetetrahydrofolate dehydrogenase/5,10-methenyltetrahydrofolate cyclohydrolase [Chlamydiales bacterium]|nr:bifunctional 5,10-methylenetetrahydrofolate dehydrogenase/5,10-methenyltetrahydrofolate cyclohydrolase [Chlamydiales bacterium]
MIINGKLIAEEIRSHIKQEIERLKGRKPQLVLLLVGKHPASLSYVRAKKKACLEAGMISSVIELEIDITQEKLLSIIQSLNVDPLVDGILVQMPLPGQLLAHLVTNAIDPEKDVDGFHPYNMGKLLLGEEGGFIPCTPKGVLSLLHHAQVPIEGKHAVIIGRSNIVGKPLAALLVQKKTGCNATVTIAHSGSEEISRLTKSADILIAAIGQPLWLKQEMVKPGAAVIDVGINRTKEGALVGDVDFAAVSQVANWITPVPGGVGPMTIAMLLQNTLESYKRRYQ